MSKRVNILQDTSTIMEGYPRIGKRLEPAEGITPKLGDKVVYEVIYDDGQVGTITTFVDKFDLMISGENN